MKFHIGKELIELREGANRIKGRIWEDHTQGYQRNQTGQMKKKTGIWNHYSAVLSEGRAGEPSGDTSRGEGSTRVI